MEKECTHCYAYFYMKGTFDPTVITKVLDIVPDEIRTIGDLRKNGKAYQWAS